MPSIDERVVAMSFENAVFEQRVAQTMNTLSKLNASIAKVGAVNGLENIEKSANKVTLEAPLSAMDKLRAKFSRGVDSKPIEDIEKSGNKVTLEQPNKAVDHLQSRMGQLSAGTTFTDIEKAADRVDLNGISRALDNVSNRFSVLEGAAAVALGNITSKAAMAGANFGKSFAFGPIKQGFQEYATNLGSIQTILANTQDSGGNLKTVNAALSELNTYSDKTIYNFSEMAKNIGTFTAAGVHLKPATDSIKGIANLAALSGSNSQQASTAMYQLSQAIAAGKVGLQDWNSVVNAGMGGAVFQKALIRTAGNMGTIEKGAIKIDKATGKATINGESFRESISAKPGQKSWLTSDVLTKTLGQFTGDLKDADLAAQGFNASQIKAIQAQAKTAQAAATQVKTLPQVFDVARETIGSGWAKTFQTIFGDFGESKKTFTELSNTINNFINTNAKARNKVLGDWKELGGRTELIKGIKAAFEALMSVLKPIKDAFREVFPAKTGKDLYEFTVRFKNLMDDLKIGSETANNLKRTFAGFFAILHIGWTIIKDVGKVLFDLLGIAGKGAGGFLNFTGGIGDFLVGLDKAISKGNALGGFFKGLENILRVPLELIRGLAAGLSSLFSSSDVGGAKQHIQDLKEFGKVLSPVERGITAVKEAWKKFSDVFAQFKQMASPWLDQISGVFSNLGTSIADGIKNANFDKVLLAFQTTFLGGIFLTLKKAVTGGKSFDITGGALTNLSKSLQALTGNLTAMQKQVQATTIFTIAASVVALALGVKLLSTIDPKKMATAMTAVAVGLGELGAALKLMAAGKGAILTLPVIATGMFILAGALVVLAAAVKIFSTMSWEELAKGLAGVGGALAVIAGGLKLMPAVRIVPIAAGLILMGVALNLIAVATKIFASLKWEELAKGLLGIAGALTAMGVGLAFIGPSILVVGPGLIAAAIGMTLLAGAISAFGSMKLGDLAKGILGAALAVAALGVATLAIPPTIGLQAAGLILLGIGLTALAGAIAVFGSMGIGKLVKGIIGIGGALLVLGAGLVFMSGTLAGSAALLAAAAGLAVLAPTLAFMGVLPWSVILKGLAAMALSMGVIAVVGLVAAPALLALGGALAILGVGLVLIGSAIFIAAKGLSLLGENGAKGIGVLVASITAFIALIPSMVINFVKGLVSIADEIAKVAPKVVLALGVILDTIIAFIIEQAPKVAVAVSALITAILNVLAVNAGPLITAGWHLLQQLLTGIENNIGSITTKVGEIITKFLDAFATQVPRLVQSGARVLGSLLGGIATALPTVLASAARVVGKFLEGVTAHLPAVITKGAALIVTFLTEITKHVPDFVKAGAKLIFSVIVGIGNTLGGIITAGVRVIKKFVFGIAQAVPDLVDAGYKAVIKLINGTAAAIRENSHELNAAGINLASAIIDGMVDGFKQLGHKAIDGVKGIISGLPGAAKKLLGIHSPSTVFAEIGKFSMLGLSAGLDGNHKSVMDSAGNIGNGLINKFKDVFQIQSPSKVLKEIGQEVGRGFKDGLDGSATDIRNSFQSLKDKIRTEMENQRQAISDENAKIRDLQQQHADKLAEIQKLRTAKKPDTEAIKTAVGELNDINNAINASERAVNKYKGVLGALRGANADLTKGLQDEKRQLIGLSKNYEDISTKLDAAKTALEDATRTRDDALRSYADQYATGPDMGALLSDALSNADLTEQERQDKIRKDREEAEKRSRIDQVANYKKALEEQIAATKQYQATLQKLRELGLDDTTYKKLLAQGLAGQDFASQLLATGKSGIDDLNKMDAQLIAESTDLAKQAAYNLYQAGVDAAQGLVDGLAQKKGDLEKAMTDLADTIVNRIKSDLGIRSPSKIFAEVGRFATQGLAQGLRASSSTVANAAAEVGDDAAKALTNSLANISDLVGSEIDTDLTITPVLDLSKVANDASKLRDLTNVVPITAAASYGQASAISTETSVTMEEAAAAAQAAPSFKFEQNNYSPESLSETEIYRQTNNQLSQIKRNLGLIGLQSA
jgi:tape measure domain-containing protein